MATTMPTTFKLFILLLLLMGNPITVIGGESSTDSLVHNSQYPTPSRCLIVLPAFYAEELPPVVMQMMSPVLRLAERMNCSAVRLPIQSAGQLAASGSYDGGAGAVQRNEIDMLLAFWRSDFFPIVAGHTTTQGFPADVLIISRRNDSYLLNTHMTLVT